VDADVATSNFRSMDQYLSLTIALRRYNLQLLSVFAFAALALALAGIYGVISFSVNQWEHEIGVRLALGAQHSHVLKMVIIDGIKPVAAGLVLGLLGVLGLTKALASLVYAVSASDPATLAGVALLFACVSLAARYLPRSACDQDRSACYPSDRLDGSARSEVGPKRRSRRSPDASSTPDFSPEITSGLPVLRKNSETGLNCFVT
jgi:hypothetical protein